MAEQELSIGEIGRTVQRIEANMVTKDAYGVVIQGLIDADHRQESATKALGTRFDDAEKLIKSAATARVNMWIMGGIALLGSAALRFWPGP